MNGLQEHRRQGWSAVSFLWVSVFPDCVVPASTSAPHTIAHTFNAHPRPSTLALAPVRATWVRFLYGRTQGWGPARSLLSRKHTARLCFCNAARVLCQQALCEDGSYSSCHSVRKLCHRAICPLIKLPRADGRVGKGAGQAVCSLFKWIYIKFWRGLWFFFLSWGWNHFMRRHQTEMWLCVIFFFYCIILTAVYCSDVFI